MCTVSITASEQGFWLCSNRDESRNRTRAEAPALRNDGRYPALYPIDPKGGGTWIAVNCHGLAATVLNNSDGSNPAGSNPPSRGGLILNAMDCRSADEAESAIRELNLPAYKPFALVLCDAALSPRTLLWNGAELQGLDNPLPSLWCSSGIDQAAAEESRRPRFLEWIERSRAFSLADLQTFHFDRSGGGGVRDVLMDAGSVATVSVTAVHVSPEFARIYYAPDPHDNAALQAVGELPLVR